MTTERSRVEIRIGAELEASVRRAFNRAVDEVGKLDDEVAEADRRVRQLDQRFERIGGTLRGLGGALAGFGAAVTGAIGLSVNNTLENIRELREEATRQSVSLRDAAVSQQIALNLGLEGDAGRAVEIFGELERRIENIDEADLFESLGLDQNRLRVLEDFERLDVVVRRILEAPASLRGGLVDRLLGGEGGEAIAQLLTGVDTIEEWNDAVRRAESNPRVVNIDNLEEAQREMAQLSNEFSDLQTQLTVTFIPTLRSLADFIAPVLQGTRQWAQSNPELARSLGLVSLSAGGLGVAMLGIGTALPGINRGYRALIINTRIATAVQWAWNAAQSASPIGLAVTAVGALAAGIAYLALTQRRSVGANSEYSSGINDATVELNAAGDAILRYVDAAGQQIETEMTLAEVTRETARERADERLREAREALVARRILLGETEVEARRAVFPRETLPPGPFGQIDPDVQRTTIETLELIRQRRITDDRAADIVETLGGPIDRRTGQPVVPERRIEGTIEARDARIANLNLDVEITQDSEGNITNVSARSGGEVADARLR